MPYCPYEWRVRVKAAKALWWEHGNFPAAYDRLEEWVPNPDDRPPRPNLHSFIDYWSFQLEHLGSVLSRSPPGQPPAMSNKEADDCIELLLKGYKTGRGHKYFSSVKDALQRSKKLGQLADKYGYNHRSLLRRLKHRQPELSRRTLRFIKKMKPSVCKERLTYCKGLLKKGDDGLRRYLARVIWLDAKKLYVCPKPYLVYAPHGSGEESALLVGGLG